MVSRALTQKPSEIPFSPLINLNNAEEICLHIDTTTWARDSHELFDYEARQVYKRSYLLKHNSRLFRTMLNIEVIPEGFPLPSQAADYLLSVRYRDGKFAVVPAEKCVVPSGPATINTKKVWLIVRDLPGNKHIMKEGDVIKLGRFKLRVKRLVKDNTQTAELQVVCPEIVNIDRSVNEMSKMQCRICLVEGGTLKDPLVSPCQCKGSIEHVHIECLKHWISGKVPDVHGATPALEKDPFYFKQASCELCKSPISTFFKINSELFSLMHFPKFKAPFLILENLVGNGNHGVYIINMDEGKELKLGRGHEADVRIADVSISRCHATITFKDEEFILKDHCSKFGTLVSLRRFHIVGQAQPLSVQVGRTVLSMSVQRHPPVKIENSLRTSKRLPHHSITRLNGEDSPRTLKSSEQAFFEAHEEPHHMTRIAAEDVLAYLATQRVEPAGSIDNRRSKQQVTSRLPFMESVCAQSFPGKKTIENSHTSKYSNVAAANSSREPHLSPHTEPVVQMESVQNNFMGSPRGSVVSRLVRSSIYGSESKTLNEILNNQLTEPSVFDVRDTIETQNESPRQRWSCATPAMPASQLSQDGSLRSREPFSKPHPTQSALISRSMTPHKHAAERCNNSFMNSVQCHRNIELGLQNMSSSAHGFSSTSENQSQPSLERLRCYPSNESQDGLLQNVHGPLPHSSSSIANYLNSRTESLSESPLFSGNANLRSTKQCLTSFYTMPQSLEFMHPASSQHSFSQQNKKVYRPSSTMTHGKPIVLSPHSMASVSSSVNSSSPIFSAAQPAWPPIRSAADIQVNDQYTFKKQALTSCVLNIQNSESLPDSFSRPCHSLYPTASSSTRKVFSETSKSQEAAHEHQLT